MLDILGDRGVYHDTDSIVYIVGDLDTELVKTVCMLGDWCDELGKSVCINYSVLTGPKSYGFRETTSKEMVKIKGFTLNYKNSQKLNIEAMEEILLFNEEKMYNSTVLFVIQKQKMC